MITRPLDLASKLRREPRSMDAMFFVNAGLLVLFFSLFGSRFVLAPGLGLDFRLPTAVGALSNARIATHMINVISSGQIFTSDGSRTREQFIVWLNAQAKSTPDPVLLVRASFGVPSEVLADIASAARVAGFAHVIWAVEERPPARGAR